MTREILDLLEDINGRGTTIVMVTHSPECAARAHRQIHLLDGKVVDLDAPPVAGPRASRRRRRAGGLAMLALPPPHRAQEPAAQPGPLRRDRRRHRAGHRGGHALLHRPPRMAKDPIPHKSDVLHYVRLDSWDPRAGASRTTTASRPSSPTATHAEIMKTRHPGRARPRCSRPSSTCSRTPRSARPKRDAHPPLLRRLLPHVRRAVQVRLGLGPQGGPGPGAGGGAGRGDERPAVRRDRTAWASRSASRTASSAWSACSTPGGPSVKFYDITQRRHPAPGAGLHAVQLAAAHADPHRGQQRRLEERRPRPGSRACSSPRPDLDPDVGGAARRGHPAAVRGLPEGLRHRAEEGRPLPAAAARRGDAGAWAHGRVQKVTPPRADAP